MAAEAREVVFQGHVQGVGFRYATQAVARGFAVAGYVRNQEDGSVLLVAEGEPAELDAFVAAIGERMSGFIRHIGTNPRTPEQLTGFEIRT